MPLITINGNSLDPVEQRPTLQALRLEPEDASKSNFVLIQSAEPLSIDQKEELFDLGAHIHEEVSQNTYLCRYEPTDLKPIQALSHVAWANVYPQAFVVPPNLKGATTLPEAQGVASLAPAPFTRVPRAIDVALHKGLDANTSEIKKAIVEAAHLDEDCITVCRDKIRLTVEEKYLDDIAAIDEVRFIEEVKERKLYNNVARKILLGGNGVRVNSTSYEGDGEIICVADTGIDSAHPAFSGRILKRYAIGRNSTGRTDDPDGHGTHVCGSVLGDGVLRGSGTKVQGTAPKASLVMQSVFGNGGLRIPENLADLFTPPYENDKARVHNNSWGAVTPGLPYDRSCREIDRFVHEHPDMVIVFAAGNDGVDRSRNGVVEPRQIGSQAAAKNCITVGASENERPELDVTYGSLWRRDFPSAPINGDLCAENPDGMAAFSSRGPTPEGRIKPDIVAPGSGILSTSSSIAQDSDAFGISPDPKFYYNAGTSMASPLVAGCAAILRETLIRDPSTKARRSNINPSAALIKALLINGAVELRGQYNPSEAGPSPNESSGWGRVNLTNSVIIPGRDDNVAGFGDGIPLKQGSQHTFTINIPERSPILSPQEGGGGGGPTIRPRPTLKVTLVWTDPEGPILQNDLDLTVKAANGQKRNGNMGNNAESFDRVNNVEQVMWVGMPPGDAQITIRAEKIQLPSPPMPPGTRPRDFSQAFAYAWRIA